MRLDFTGIKTTNNRPYNADYIDYINKSLINKGIDNNTRAMLLGTIIEESGGNPFAISPDGKYYGLLQWEDSRYNKSNDPKDVYEAIDSQLDTIYNTLHNTTDKMSWTHGGTGSGFNTLLDAYNTFTDPKLNIAKRYRGFSFGYVRPTGKEASYKNRLKVVNQVFKKLTEVPDNWLIYKNQTPSINWQYSVKRQGGIINYFDYSK